MNIRPNPRDPSTRPRSPLMPPTEEASSETFASAFDASPRLDGTPDPASAAGAGDADDSNVAGDSDVAGGAGFADDSKQAGFADDSKQAGFADDPDGVGFADLGLRAELLKALADLG